MERIAIRIYGEVQGVFFRFSAKRKADTLKVKGFAKNEQDGSVYIEAEGEKMALEKFLLWCHKGPLLAHVEKVEARPEPDLRHFLIFEVL